MYMYDGLAVRACGRCLCACVGVLCVCVFRLCVRLCVRMYACIFFWQVLPEISVQDLVALRAAAAPAGLCPALRPPQRRHSASVVAAPAAGASMCLVPTHHQNLVLTLQLSFLPCQESYGVAFGLLTLDVPFAVLGQVRAQVLARHSVSFTLLHTTCLEGLASQVVRCHCILRSIGPCSFPTFRSAWFHNVLMLLI